MVWHDVGIIGPVLFIAVLIGLFTCVVVYTEKRERVRRRQLEEDANPTKSPHVHFDPDVRLRLD